MKSPRVQTFTDEQRRVRLARSAAWAKENRSRVKEINAKYHASNREDRLASNAQWAKNNPEKRRKIDAASRARRREALRERTKEWVRKNPEKAAAISRAKRARKRGAEGRHTAEEVATIRSLQKDRCAYCPTKLRGKGHLDHIKPLSRGGSDWPSNLQWLCGPCNLQKGARDASEFARSKGRLL